MNLVDFIIVLLLLSSLFRGREVGFVRQLCSTVGFIGGLWLGIVLGQHFVHLAHSQLARSVLTLGITLGCAFIFLTIGEYLGIVIKNKFQTKPVNHVDNGLGLVLAFITMLIGLWLSASILLSLPNQKLQSAIKSSQIVSLLNRALPPAPTIIADLSHLIDPNGFPRVFTGNEPSPPNDITLPNLGELTAAVQKDQASVVKVEGQGCGGIVEGSGFVVAKNLIVTNAHVVAGISLPYVLDGNGSHSATAIWFNPNLDLAVLRVSDLAGSPLPLNTNTAQRGTPGAVLGYPGNGNFTAKAAVVLDSFTATGRNIYNAGDVTRDIYELKADIIPGNSGGPIVNKDGAVIGVVFAESTAYNHVGYALTLSQVSQEVHQAMSRNSVVNTGSCAE